MLIKSCTAWSVDLHKNFKPTVHDMRSQNRSKKGEKLGIVPEALRPDHWAKTTLCFTLIPGSLPALCATSSIIYWPERFHPQERTHAKGLWAGSHSSVVRALAVQVMGPGFNSQQPWSMWICFQLRQVDLKLLTLCSTLHQRKTFLQVGFLDHCTCTSLSATHQQACERVCNEIRKRCWKEHKVYIVNTSLTGL